MCPDRQILSVYLDNELPSPWKEKMEAHVASCAECRTILKQYQAVSVMANSAKDDHIKSAENSAKDRVWEQIAMLDFGEQNVLSPRGNRSSLWKHSVSISVPAAIAAALLIAFTAAFIGTAFTRPVQDLHSVAALEAQNVIPSADLARIIQYLDTQEDASSMMIINLPETENFTSSGEPALIRAADYRKRNNF